MGPTASRGLVAAAAQVPALVVLVYLVSHFMGYVEASEAVMVDTVRRNTEAMVELRVSVRQLVSDHEDVR